MRARGAAAIDVRPEVEAASDREVQARFDGTAWTRCDSWYRDDERPDRRQLAGLHARVRRADADARPGRVQSVKEWPPSVPLAPRRPYVTVPGAAFGPMTVTVPRPRASSRPDTRTPRIHSTSCSVSAVRVART